MYNIIRQGDTDQNNIIQYCCDIRENISKLDDIGTILLTSNNKIESLFNGTN